MADILNSLSANPLIFVLLVLAVGALIFAVLKRLLKLALIFVLGIGGLAGYYALTGQQAPPALERVQDGVKGKVKAGAKRGADKAKALGEKVRHEVGKAAKKEADRAAQEVGQAIKGAAEDGVRAAEDAVDP